MIRLLVRLGKWLEARFPEKLIVRVEQFEALLERLEKLELTLPQVDTLVQRLSVVESNAVHKEAVQDLILIVKQMKDEYASLKASLGMNRIGDDSIRAILNGEPIMESDPNER